MNRDSRPKGWATTDLGTIGRYLNGRGFKKSEWASNGRPIIRIQNLTGTSESYNYFRGTASSDHEVENGDLLISWAATLDAFVWRGPSAVLNQHIFKVESFIDKTFHYFALKWALAELYRNAHGTGMVHVTKKKFEQTPVMLPPLKEQQRLVDALDSHSTRLDDAEATLERVQRNLERYRASVLQAAVEGRLVPTEAELARSEGRDYEPASVLLERILAERRRSWEAAARLKSTRSSNYREPASLPTDRLSSLPEGWTWSNLDSLAEIKGGITKGQKLKPNRRYRDVPYLRVANVQRGHLDLRHVKLIRATEEEIEELKLLPGDVLFNEGGDRDKLGRGWVWRGELDECIHQNHVFRARPFSEDVVPEFLSWYANTTGQAYFIGEGKQTTNLASINMTKLRSLPVPIPPFSEQMRIRQAVDQRLSVADECLHSIAQERARCAKLRQSILKWAFEGRLVDQDPTDEPASVLLERIRAERQTAVRGSSSGRRRSTGPEATRSRRAAREHPAPT